MFFVLRSLKIHSFFSLLGKKAGLSLLMMTIFLFVLLLFFVTSFTLYFNFSFFFMFFINFCEVVYSENCTGIF